MIKVWKFAVPMKRDYECTNIVAATGNKPVNGEWVETDESALTGLTALWVENGTRLYGTCKS